MALTDEDLDQIGKAVALEVAPMFAEMRVEFKKEMVEMRAEFKKDLARLEGRIEMLSARAATLEKRMLVFEVQYDRIAKELRELQVAVVVSDDVSRRLSALELAVKELEQKVNLTQPIRIQ